MQEWHQMIRLSLSTSCRTSWDKRSVCVETVLMIAMRWKQLIQVYHFLILNLLSLHLFQAKFRTSLVSLTFLLRVALHSPLPSRSLSTWDCMLWFSIGTLCYSITFTRTWVTSNSFGRTWPSLSPFVSWWEQPLQQQNSLLYSLKNHLFRYQLWYPCWALLWYSWVCSWCFS